MRWRGERESDNVEDQRSFGPTGGVLGIGGLIAGAFVVYLLGGDPVAFLAQNANQVQTQRSAPVSEPRENDRKSFVSVVLGETEDVWNRLFRRQGLNYREPKLVLFRGRVDSACGRANSATGPFYCPGDRKVYLDTSFFDELAGKLRAPGEFAEAYVIAHEVGHHVQNLLGLERRYREQQQGADARGRNQVSVQLELQADCLAGVWAAQTERAKSIIEAGDIESAIGAASAVGDDRLQQASRGYVVPDSFTHGSSAQRVAAFRTGYQGGEIASCTR